MAKDRDNLAEGFDTDNSGGWLGGFLAEEDDLDRRSLWRLGSWGVGSVAAVVVAVMASQSSIGARRDQIASADLTRQSQQIQSVAKDSQAEARRLASAIDTLNGDRDRLYSRVTVLEQGLDSVTGSIARQTSAAGSSQAGPSLLNTAEQSASLLPPPVAAAPATTVAALTEKPRDVVPRQPEQNTAAPATSSAAADARAPSATPATPLMPPRSMMAPPDPAATKLTVPEQPPEVITATPVPEVVAAAPAAAEPAASKAASEIAVQRTEFGVDLGGANSIDGLRALWRALLKSNAAVIASLRPIIVVKERNNGLGMQLRLVAGPLSDAAAAAKICAALIESERSCETSVFDGQRLAISSEDPAPAARPPRKRSGVKRVGSEEQPPKPRNSALSSTFSTR
jgi:hypothetical protein